MSESTLSVQYAMTTPLDQISRRCLSLDHRGLNGQAAIHPVTRKRTIPAGCLPSPETHLAEMFRKGELDEARHILLYTARNLVQNLRCVVWRADLGLCQAASEHAERSERPYQGIAWLRIGGIEARDVDFRGGGGPDSEEVEVFFAGTPVLRRSQVLDVPEIAAEAFDHRHLWDCTPEQFNILSNVFAEHQHRPTEVLGTRLCEAADALQLKPCNDFLQHAVAIGPHGVTHFALTGHLQQVGRVALQWGATDCFVIENGGSLQYSLHRPKMGKRTLFESWYFREPTIAMIAYELEHADMVPVHGCAVPD